MYLLTAALERNALLSSILQRDYKHHDYQGGNHQEELQIQQSLQVVRTILQGHQRTPTCNSLSLRTHKKKESPGERGLTSCQQSGNYFASKLQPEHQNMHFGQILTSAPALGKCFLRSDLYSHQRLHTRRDPRNVLHFIDNNMTVCFKNLNMFPSLMKQFHT